jgi:hypothetical protein
MKKKARPPWLAASFLSRQACDAALGTKRIYRINHRDALLELGPDTSKDVVHVS